MPLCSLQNSTIGIISNMKTWKSNKELIFSLATLGGLFFVPITLYVIYNMKAKTHKLKYVVGASIIIASFFLLLEIS